MLKIDAELYGKYVINGQHGKKHMHSPQQGYVWHAGGSATLPPKNVKMIKLVWICHQPIRSLGGKQVDGRSKTHSGLSRRQHASVTQKRKISDKVHRLHERNIWLQYAGGEEEISHIYCNRPKLQQIGRSSSVHGQIHHRSNRRISRRYSKTIENTGRRPPFQGGKYVRQNK